MCNCSNTSLIWCCSASDVLCSCCSEFIRTWANYVLWLSSCTTMLRTLRSVHSLLSNRSLVFILTFMVISSNCFCNIACACLFCEWTYSKRSFQSLDNRSNYRSSCTIYSLQYYFIFSHDVDDVTAATCVDITGCCALTRLNFCAVSDLPILLCIYYKLCVKVSILCNKMS